VHCSRREGWEGRPAIRELEVLPAAMADAEATQPNVRQATQQVHHPIAGPVVVWPNTMPVLAHWVGSRAAADALAVSERTLHRWRSSGLLKPGVHWRRKFPTANSPLLYDIAAVETVMRDATARCARLLEVAG